jgi:hypothetical protein
MKTAFESEFDELPLCESCKKEVRELLLRYVPYLLKQEVNPSMRIRSIRDNEEYKDDKPIGRKK